MTLRSEQWTPLGRNLGVDLHCWDMRNQQNNFFSVVIFHPNCNIQRYIVKHNAVTYLKFLLGHNSCTALVCYHLWYQPKSHISDKLQAVISFSVWPNTSFDDVIYQWGFFTIISCEPKTVHVWKLLLDSWNQSLVIKKKRHKVKADHHRHRTSWKQNQMKPREKNNDLGCWSACTH